MRTLKENVERLQEIVDSVEEEMLSYMPRLDMPVHKMKDRNGRYILLDAYTALVNGQAALVRSDILDATYGPEFIQEGGG